MVISDVYFDVAVIFVKNGDNIFVYSTSFMLKMNFVILLYLKFNQGCHG